LPAFRVQSIIAPRPEAVDGAGCYFSDALRSILSFQIPRNSASGSNYEQQATCLESSPEQKSEGGEKANSVGVGLQNGTVPFSILSTLHLPRTASSQISALALSLHHNDDHRTSSPTTARSRRWRLKRDPRARARPARRHHRSESSPSTSTFVSSLRRHPSPTN
jgi:hypothetical protein